MLTTSRKNASFVPTCYCERASVPWKTNVSLIFVVLFCFVFVFTSFVCLFVVSRAFFLLEGSLKSERDGCEK